MTLRMYASKKSWPLDDVEITLRHVRRSSDGSDDTHDAATERDVIERDLTLTGDLSQEQQNRLLQIADKCPVHKTLTGTLEIETRLAPDEDAVLS